FQGCAAGRGNEVAVRPQGGQAGREVRELLAQQPRRSALDLLDQPVDTELRIDDHEQVHLIRHLDCLDEGVPFGGYPADDLFEADVHLAADDIAPVLRAPGDVVVTSVHDVVAANLVHDSTI